VIKKHPNERPAAGMKPRGGGPLRVGLISLGCAKNLVDAEIMLGALLKDGVEITNDAAQADAVIVNTCSFIDAAQEESVDTILESAEVREAKNRGQSLIVAGCLPQRFRDELPKLLPEVDAFMGIDQVAQVADIVKQALARRAEKVQGSKFKVQSPKPKIVARLAELNKNHTATELKIQNSKLKTEPAPLFGGYCPSLLHPRFRHAAFPSDAAAFRLCQNRRRLQSSVQFLYHPADARFASQPVASGYRGRSQGPAGRRREGN
jgi:hypothetical protein